jgi:hypothetical protein
MMTSQAAVKSFLQSVPGAWFDVAFGRRSALFSGIEGDRTTFGLDSSSKTKKRGTPNENALAAATTTALQMGKKVFPFNVPAEMDSSREPAAG